ncbi:MAG TPA: hypothetical protein EYP71_03640 [Dehalococcoidia bacterium]|nr:hypothetical protein [Dehalococcoidia bacterium]
MRQNKHGLFLVFFAVAVWLSNAAGCVPMQPGQVEEDRFTQLHSRLERHIQKARSIALELEDFTWKEFAAIGLEAPPSEVCQLGDRVTAKGSVDESSSFKWIPLPEMLPRPESARPLVVYCDKCLEIAEQVRLTVPSDNTTMSQWLELCRRLQSSLAAAEHLASNYKNTNNYVLSNVGNSLSNSDAAIERKHLKKFQNKSAQYLELLDEFTHNLQQARQALLQLANWRN